MKILIKADIPDRWVDTFLSMLKKLEYLGTIGSSRGVMIYSDGDGDFRPKFEFDTEFEELDKPEMEGPTSDYFYDAG